MSSILLLIVSSAHVQMALDLADRPVVGPVQAMQVVDLFSREHGPDPIYTRIGVAGTRNDVLCKIPAGGG